MDSENPSSWNVVSRVLLTTSTGAIQLWEQHELKWTREEALTGITVAEFVEIPEKVASESGEGEDSESFTTRLTRQISDAKVSLSFHPHHVVTQSPP